MSLFSNRMGAMMLRDERYPIGQFQCPQEILEY